MFNLLKKILRLSLFFLITSFSWLFVLIIHELGHTKTAKLLGDNNAYFKIVEFTNGKLTAIGSNQYDIHAFNWGQIIVISLAGVGFTYMLALVMLFLKNNMAKNKNIKESRLLEFSLNSIIFWGMFDLVFQEIQGLVANIAERPIYCGGTTGICGNDFADVFWILYEKIASLFTRHGISINPFIIIDLIKLISLTIVAWLVWFIWKKWKALHQNTSKLSN